QSQCRSGSEATTRPTRGGGTTGDGTGYSGARRSSRPPREEQRPDPLGRAGELVLLDGARGIHVLGAHLRALAHEGALPDAVAFGEDLQALRRPLVPRVHVIALGQGDGGRTDEARLKSVDGARGVAEHAVDAQAELLVRIELIGRLQVLALARRLLLLAEDPGLHLLQLPQEIG